MLPIQLAKDSAALKGRAWIGLWDLLLAVYETDTLAAGILRSAGFNRSTALDLELIDAPVAASRAFAPEVVSHLSWTAGFLAGSAGGQEAHGTAFVLSCVGGPTSTMHHWLARCGVDHSELFAIACRSLDVPLTADDFRRWREIDPSTEILGSNEVVKRTSGGRVFVSSRRFEKDA